MIMIAKLLKKWGYPNNASHFAECCTKLSRSDLEIYCILSINTGLSGLTTNRAAAGGSAHSCLLLQEGASRGPPHRLLCQAPPQASQGVPWGYWPTHRGAGCGALWSLRHQHRGGFGHLSLFHFLILFDSHHGWGGHLWRLGRVDWLWSLPFFLDGLLFFKEVVLCFLLWCGGIGGLVACAAFHCPLLHSRFAIVPPGSALGLLNIWLFCGGWTLRDRV